MPRFSRTILCAATTAALTVTALVASAPGAAAVTATSTLPTRSVDMAHPSAMVFAHDRLFLSGDDSVQVLDTDGRLQRTLADLPGASGEVASADGSRVYVALHDASAIAVVDADSLQVSRLATQACPTGITLVGGRLFYSSGCVAGTGTISSIDPGSGGTPVPSGVAADYYLPPLLASGGDTLVAGLPNVSPAKSFSYRVTGAALTSLGESDIEGSMLQGLAVSPDGDTVYVSSGDPYVLRSFATDLQTKRTFYTTDEYPHGVAVSPDGSRVAAGVDNQGANLLVFEQGSSTATVAGSARPSDFSYQPGVLPQTLGFSTDGSRVYALVGTYERAWFTSAPTTPVVASDLRLSVRQPTEVGGPATLTAVLAGRSSVTVDLEITSGGTTSVEHVTTGPDGRASLTRTVPAGAAVVASYPGDARHDKARTEPVTVQDVTTLTLGKVTSPSGRTGTVKTTATLAVPRAGVPVTFSLQQPGKTLDDIKTSTVVVSTDANGVATLSRKVSTGGRVGAAYAGDDAYQPSETKRSFWQVSSTTHAVLTGKHKTKHGKLYYTKASRVLLDVDVDPSTAEQVHVQLQQKSGPHWKTKVASDEALDHGGLTLQLDSVAKRKDLRFVVSFEGDHATRGSKATTKTFRVG